MQDEVRRLASEVLERPVEDDSRLHVDSVEALQLISSLERRFGIEIDDAELTPENFESVASLAELVRRLATGPSGESSR